MVNFERLSDFEINKIVARYIFSEITDLELRVDSDDKKAVMVESEGFIICSFDFNNPVHSHRIILENKIALYPVSCMSENLTLDYTDDWVASLSLSVENGYEVKHKNPLRAAMIVYLIMKERA